MRYIISPSVLSADFSKLGDDMNRVEKAGAKWIHLDVMDGMFVPNISIGIPVVGSIRKSSDLFFDVHLMIEDPIRYIKRFADAGSDMITFHEEAAKDSDAAIDLIHSLGKKAGITIKPGTPLDVLTPYLPKVDMVLLMTVEPGFGGQSYIEASTQRIASLVKKRADMGLSFDIEVDGGINAATLKTVINAGANVIVAGSYVFKGDIEANVRTIINEFPSTDGK